MKKAILACAWTAAASAGPAGAPIPSGIVPHDQARLTLQSWGEMRTAFSGETHGVKDLIAAEITLNPGQEMHPPHQHAEEQFVFIVEGRGTWHLNGKDQPARPGDVAYAAPWDWHGLKNTGDAPLRMLLLKWGYKGVESPPKPEGRH